VSGTGVRVSRVHSTGVLAAWALGAGGVVAQMVFPFTDGGTVALTVASVVLLAAAAVLHAAATRGPRSAAALVAVAAGGGLLAEAVGVRWGVPFGDYDYTGTLGLELLGVPVLVPLAWAMMAYPALLVGRVLAGARGRLATAAVAAWTLTAWDVFLDPQMVDAGHWRWEHPTPALPGVEGIPLTNFAGWLAVSFAMSLVLDRLVSRRPIGDDLLPLSVVVWTYASSVLAHAVFFGRPPVAVAGGVLMGLTVVPLVVLLVRRRRE
jgi:uncharacterized membrane protein